MKNSKTCPKCGSKRILVGKYVDEGRVAVNVGAFFTLNVLCYTCVDCGYIESWVDGLNHDDLKKRYENLHR